MLTQKNDLKIIENNFKRTPRDVIKVITRCNDGYPQVILTNPLLSNGQPFPTIYYLVCPFLIKQVFDLESEGLTDILEKRIERETEFRSKFKDAQKAFINKRLELLDKRQLGDNIAKSLKSAGIAGNLDLTKVKCLHAHYAHFLVNRTNPVGKIVNQRIGALQNQEICKSCKSSDVILRRPTILGKK